MAAAADGDTVYVHYTGRLADGRTFDSSEEREPLRFTLGRGMVIPGFEAAVLGMAVGERKRAEIPVDQAYGPRRQELVMAVERSRLPEGMDPKPGDHLSVQTTDGSEVPVVVSATHADAIELDANHPLAGEDLTFDLLLVEID